MDLRRLDMNLLLVLDALYDERSVTGAARRLKLSQPTISVSLAKLRTALDDELFVRSAGGMTPTPRAERLRDPVRRIIATIVEEILPAERFEPGLTRRPFVLCLSDVGEMVFLPKLLERLRQLCPLAPVVSVSLRPGELAAALEAGQVDLAMGYFPDLNAGIFQQGLFDHAFTCLARRGHAGIGERLDMQTFLSLDHLVVNAEGRSQEIFERFMHAQGDTRRIALRTPHFMSAPMIVAKSEMITTVPRAVGLVWSDRASVQLLHPPVDVPPIPLKQFWHKRFNEDARLTWLRETIADLFLGKDPSDEHGFAQF